VAVMCTPFKSLPGSCRGPFLTSPLGANFDPRGEVVPWGGEVIPWGEFSVDPSILLNCRVCSPLGVKEGVNIPPRGQISPLGARGEVKNGPLERKPGIFWLQLIFLLR
jgi:hypothetical protein